MTPLQRSSPSVAVAPAAQLPGQDPVRAPSPSWVARLVPASAGGTKLGRLAGQARSGSRGDAASMTARAVQITQEAVRRIHAGRVSVQEMQALERSVAAYLRADERSPGKCLLRIAGTGHPVGGPEHGGSDPGSQCRFVLPPRLQARGGGANGVAVR